MQAINTAAASSSTPRKFSDVAALMQLGIAEQVFPGAVLIVAHDGQIVYSQCIGGRTYATEGAAPYPMMFDTVFDVAALTNVVATTTMLMKLVESGKLDLNDRVSRYLQGFGVFNKSAITVGQLLSHTSGLAHWFPFFEELLRLNAGPRLGVLTSRGAREYILNTINRSHLKHPSGTRQVFSDIGFIILGHIVETLTGVPLDRAAHRHVFQPLGMRSTSFIDLALIKRRGIHPVTEMIAPTEECSWRKRILCGEVHDDNAWAMGGVAGHSGLFSTAVDLHTFAWEMIASYRGGSGFLRRETLEQFWARPSGNFECGWAHGWELPSRENGMIEAGFSDRAVGHNGFTGCSLWIEPERGVDVVLLSNRIHPSRSNKKIQGFRTELHRAVLKELTQL